MCVQSIEYTVDRIEHFLVLIIDLYFQKNKTKKYNFLKILMCTHFM